MTEMTEMTDVSPEPPEPPEPLEPLEPGPCTNPIPLHGPQQIETHDTSTAIYIHLLLIDAYRRYMWNLKDKIW